MHSEINYYDDSMYEFELADLYNEMDDLQDCNVLNLELELENKVSEEECQENLNKENEYNCFCDLVKCECIIESKVLRSSNVKAPPVIRFESYMILFKKWKEEFKNKKQTM